MIAPAPLTSRPTIARSNHIAILIDYENIAKAGINTIAKRVNDLIDKHPIALVRAYAGWGRFNGAKSVLSELGAELTELPANRAGKNSADMQLATDAAELLFTRPAVSTLVLLSGDRDFVPLARLAHKQGREFWVIAPRDAASKQLRAVSDRFEIMSSSAPLPTTGLSKPAAPSVDAAVSLIDTELAGHIGWAIVTSQRIGRLPTASHLQPHRLEDRNTSVPLQLFIRILSRLDPQFDAAAFSGRRRRTNIICANKMRAEGWITIRSGTDHEVIPTEKLSRHIEASPEPSGVSEIITEMTARRWGTLSATQQPSCGASHRLDSDAPSTTNAFLSNS